MVQVSVHLLLSYNSATCVKQGEAASLVEPLRLPLAAVSNTLLC